MKHHLSVVAALAFCTVLTARSVSAQDSAAYYESHSPAANDGAHGVSPAQYCEGGGCEDGYCADGYAGDGGCCDSCGAYGGDCACACAGGGYGDWLTCCTTPGSIYFTADYLYVKSTFSEAVAYLDQNDNVQNVGTDTFHELDFQYESSYRFGGGYRLDCCGEELRFMFTRLSSYGSTVAPQGSFVPYEVSSPPGGQTFIDGSVDVKTYDFEYAKTIPLGGTCASACGDPCAPSCPAWDITWSGGFRFAQVDTSRLFSAVNADDIITTDARALMDFNGGGVRFGMEGRRYFGPGGCLSAYMKGDISLLYGRIDLEAERVVDGGTAQDLFNSQTLSHRQIVPVTEIETGLTGHITQNSALTAGYLFHAWHDLGYRDSFNFPTFMETGYDDANILGFNGFFARLEFGF